MIYATQLIYLKPGQQKIFNEFESVAIPLISKYEGNLMLRIRPNDETLIEAGIERPYEVHIVSFPSEKHLEQFMKDEERKKYLHLKEQSIEKVILIKGTQF